ncbi:EthD domain-containing protein [Phenylobacterium sp.]|jgi:hypothetical protein|uniref:EthD domain-containing protein n=1 Tax=Phenylobacterium sp. TaxID=1871053 RepID=UPI002F3FCFD2
MSKMIYVARRKPGMTPEAFVARWRRHGALAMSLPLWRRMSRYVQASVIQPAPIAGASADYDAVGVVWQWDDARPAGDPAGARTLEADELETFSGPIPPLLLDVDEQVLSDDGAGRTTAYLWFNDLDAARRAAETAAAGAEGRPAPNRVVLNRVSEPNPYPCVLPFKAIVEISARDTDGLRRVLGADGADPLRSDLAVVAREAILWG